MAVSGVPAAEAAMSSSRGPLGGVGWAALVLAFVGLVLGAAFVGSRAFSGEYSPSCGIDEARHAFEMAEVPVDELTVVDGCSEVTTGFDACTVHYAVASGSHQQVTDAVDAIADQGDSDYRTHLAIGGRRQKLPFDVPVTPHGERNWRSGERLSRYDTIETADRRWSRYVTWGTQRSGRDDLVGVKLETTCR